MRNFYVGQKVRYVKEGKDIPKGFIATVLHTGHLEEKPVVIISYDGVQIPSYQRHWEPVDEKHSEDLFQ